MTPLTRYWLLLIGHIPIRVLKGIVYSLLVVNLIVYLHRDWVAAQTFVAPDLPLAELLGLFATSIDVIAWLTLVFLFEIETWLLSNRGITRRTSWGFLGVKGVCYLSALFAFYAYADDTRWLYQATRLEMPSSLCALADGEVSFQIGFDYQTLTSENCAALTSDPVLYWLEPGTLLTDRTNLGAARLLGWIDLINGATWLLVILLLQVEVWQDARAEWPGWVLPTARRVKVLLYTLLTAVAAYWATRGLLLDAWDGLLWLGGFGAIDLSLAEWERKAGRASSPPGPA